MAFKVLSARVMLTSCEGNHTLNGIVPFAARDDIAVIVMLTSSPPYISEPSK